MIKIAEEKYLIRDGEKIGRISENHILDKEGDRIGYVHTNDIYNREGSRVGYVSDEHVYDSRSNTRFPVSELKKRIAGGTQSDVERAAILLLLGE